MMTMMTYYDNLNTLLFYCFFTWLLLTSNICYYLMMILFFSFWIVFSCELYFFSFPLCVFYYSVLFSFFSYLLFFACFFFNYFSRLLPYHFLHLSHRNRDLHSNQKQKKRINQKRWDFWKYQKWKKENSFCDILFSSHFKLFWFNYFYLSSVVFPLLSSILTYSILLTSPISF